LVFKAAGSETVGIGRGKLKWQAISIAKVVGGHLRDALPIFSSYVGTYYNNK